MLFFFISFLFGRGPTYALKPFTTGLKPNVSYLKAVVIHGQMYSKGVKYRDKQVYTLNEDCTEFLVADTLSLSWIELLHKFGKKIPFYSWMNISKNLTRGPPKSLPPFFALFLPLSIGIVLLWTNRPILELVLLFLYVVPFLIIIPLLQFHVRYIYPFATIALPLVGIGVNQMLVGVKSVDCIKRQISRTFAFIIIILSVFYGIYFSRAGNDEMKRKISVNYQDAALWIDRKHKPNEKFSVMSNYHGIYGYFWKNKTLLPLDPIDRIAKYCRFSSTRYIVIGPDEIKFNPDFSKEFDAGDTVILKEMKMKVVADFGKDKYTRVQIVEVSELGEKNVFNSIK